LLPLQVARNAASKARPGGTLLFMGGTGGRRTAAGLAFISALTAALPALTKNLALELAPIRVNLIAAGPLRTMAAKSIPGFNTFEDAWNGRAPLGWDNANAEPVARTAVALMSDWLPATTGEIVHVDGGFHAMGV